MTDSVAPTEPRAQARRPSHRLMSITSGPMSEGMIPSVRAEDGLPVRKTDSTEHVCLFSVCLMFIGVPIIVIGILCLSIVAPFGIIMTIIGVTASVSGAVLVILFGVITLLKGCVKQESKAEEYTDEGPPEIIIGETLYSEEFSDNLCREQEEQGPSEDLSDLPNMEQLDPINWSNYPEAQNPKSYLNSFGELPKVMPSPDNRCFTPKNKCFGKISKKSRKKIGRKISNSLGMGTKHKTLSKTSLTREYSDEIHSDSSTSSLASTSSNRSTKQDQIATTYKISANECGMDSSNQSIIIIENVGHDLAQDCTDDEVLTTGVIINNEDPNHMLGHKKKNKTQENNSNNNCIDKEQNQLFVNCILPEECTDSIELTEIVDRDAEDKNGYIKYEEHENYSDILDSIRSKNES